MRYWLIGCGSLLVIVIVLGVIGYGYLKDFAQEIAVVMEECKALDNEFPFEKPTNGIIEADFYDKYVSCRRGMLGEIDAYFTGFEDEETSAFKKVSMGFSMFSALGGAFNTALRHEAMSPYAYEWLANQTLLAVKYAERPDAPEELKRLYRELEAFFDGRQTGDGGLEVTIEGSNGGKSLKEVLPPVDAEFISMPEENLAVVVANVDTLIETKNVFIFDHLLLEILKQDKEQRESN